MLQVYCLMFSRNLQAGVFHKTRSFQLISGIKLIYRLKFKLGNSFLSAASNCFSTAPLHALSSLLIISSLHILMLLVTWPVYLAKQICSCIVICIHLLTLHVLSGRTIISLEQISDCPCPPTESLQRKHHNWLMENQLCRPS